MVMVSDEISHNWWVKRVLNNGQGVHNPKFDSKCRVTITCDEDDDRIFDNVVYESSPSFEITVGQPCNIVFIAVDECLQTMKLGENCEIEVYIHRCRYVCRTNNPVNAKPVVLKINLNEFTNGEDIWDLSIHQRLRFANDSKEEGVRRYSSKRIGESFYFFSLCKKMLITISDEDRSKDEFGEYKDLHNDLNLSCSLNLALCQLSAGSYSKVIKNCSDALTSEPNNVKALYRRGMALTSINEYEQAGVDLKKAESLDPNNKLITKQLEVLSFKIRASNRKYARSLKKMFE